MGLLLNSLGPHTFLKLDFAGGGLLSWAFEWQTSLWKPDTGHPDLVGDTVLLPFNKPEPQEPENKIYYLVLREIHIASKTLPWSWGIFPGQKTEKHHEKWFWKCCIWNVIIQFQGEESSKPIFNYTKRLFFFLSASFSLSKSLSLFIAFSLWLRLLLLLSAAKHFSFKMWTKRICH